MRPTNIVASLIGLGLVSFSQPSAQRSEATAVSMDFTRRGGFYSAPFPNEDLRKPDGRLDLSAFPGRGKATVVDAALEQLGAEARGFSTTAGIFFALNNPLDPGSLPGAAESTAADATVYLLDVDPRSAGFGARIPIDVGFVPDGGRFGAPNLLSLLPYQGVPLREGTLYAAVVTVRVRDRWMRPLRPAASLRSLLDQGTAEGLRPAALSEITTALASLRTRAQDLAAIAVFRTGAPTSGMAAVREAILAERTRLEAPLTAAEVFPDFCVYRSTVQLPQYQGGTPPFVNTGGRWVLDAKGTPVRQRYERGQVVVTLPRSAMPSAGFPTVVFTRAGAGVDNALVDHGARAPNGRTTPGSGPAVDFARAGFAGISIDGPLGGLRNPQNADEQFLIFNTSNPAAIRDNVRQSAAELILTAHLLDDLQVDAEACTGLATPAARFDVGRLALFGHSTGATIAPLALAFEPRFGAAILSGAGGSWIANLLHKQKPLPARHLTELMLGYKTRLFSVTEGDPALSLIQWAAEAADPVVYGDRILANVLMFQGIVDHYILPPMANAASLSMKLDLAGEALDGETAELGEFRPFRDVAAFSGRRQVRYPVTNNAERGDGRTVTAAVVQRPGDGLQDGHEVVWQTAGPKYQYRCFLATYARGAARVPAPNESLEVCH